ncbi:putative sulfate exporter family transporter [Variovorax paradoxus]|uniref:Putative sulfate exporter family transporter n=1 Tax=Variovorax paradoxus TaxID=34073 RepID=A0A5Q0MC55_VARPD|nr:putative sulfate exporter family transporter [Variovorax paradoxus]QFZ86224.1 putative sulfate exporter family transporter [Variovorax paradoxus]
MTTASASIRGQYALRHAMVLMPGVALAGVVALAATFVSTLHGGPQFLYALFFGVAFHYLSQDAKAKPGIEFCARGVLRLGVGLLGARITATQIVGLGWSTALIVIAAVVTTLLCGVLLGKKLGLSRAQSVLSGGAVAICGASAALAISAVLPREKDGDRFTLMVVVTVTVLSTLAMVIYPLVAKLAHLSPAMAGLFIGGTIHDVAQVVGAGYTLSHEAGDYATIVKLFRVAMLTVVVVVVSSVFKKQREEAQAASAAGRSPTKQALVPWFLWLFVIMVIANSLHMLPPVAQNGINDSSRACLVIAISALGIKTSFAQLARAGWRPFVLLLVETLWMAGLVLAAILLRP